MPLMLENRYQTRTTNVIMTRKKMSVLRNPFSFARPLILLHTAPHKLVPHSDPQGQPQQLHQVVGVEKHKHKRARKRHGELELIVHLNNTAARLKCFFWEVFA